MVSSSLSRVRGILNLNVLLDEKMLLPEDMADVAIVTGEDGRTLAKVHQSPQFVKYAKSTGIVIQVVASAPALPASQIDPTPRVRFVSPGGSPGVVGRRIVHADPYLSNDEDANNDSQSKKRRIVVGQKGNNNSKNRNGSSGSRRNAYLSNESSSDEDADQEPATKKRRIVVGDKTSKKRKRPGNDTEDVGEEVREIVELPRRRRIRKQHL